MISMGGQSDWIKCLRLTVSSIVYIYLYWWKNAKVWFAVVRLPLSGSHGPKWLLWDVSYL